MTEFKISNNKFKRAFYLTLGFFFVSLGIIGAFLPIMPTTIFLILATWSFMRSSEKYYIWLTTNRYFGRLIKNYHTYRGIEPKARLKSLIILWITLAITIIMVPTLLIFSIMLLVGIGVTWHLLALKTLTIEEIEKIDLEFNQ